MIIKSPVSLKNRKQEDSKFVSDGTKYLNGTCKFGQNNCLFTHKKPLKRNRMEDDEI